MGRPRTLLAGLGMAGLLVLSGAAPGTAADDDTILVFNFENEDSVIEEHTAQMLWNLNTDNLDLERFPLMEGWNSNYLEVAEKVTGTIRADLEAMTLTGIFAETWQCSGGCVDEEGTPYYPDDMDTGFVVAVQEGWLVPDGPMWKVDAIASIAYKATVSYDEKPSECAGEVCYTCLGRVCKVNETMTATADLEGWIDGDTLSLAFKDRLEADTTQMDFSELLETQFFMSRFSITITGATLPPVADATDTDEPDGVDENEAVDVSSSEPAAEAPPDASETPQQAATSDQDTAQGDATSTDDPTADPTQSATESEEVRESLLEKFGLYLAMLLLLFLLLPGGAIWWKKATQRPPRPPPPPPTVSGEVVAGPGEPTQAAAPEVAHQLVGIEGRHYVEGRDKFGGEVRYPEGTFVKIVGKAGVLVKVQVGSGQPIWVDQLEINTTNYKDRQPF